MQTEPLVKQRKPVKIKNYYPESESEITETKTLSIHSPDVKAAKVDQQIINIET